MAGSVVGVGQNSQLATGRVGAVVGLGGEHHDDAELIGGRTAQLVGEDVDDLGRPEKLILQVDDLASRTERAHVGRQNSKVAARLKVVDLLGDRAYDLKREVARLAR